MKNLRDYINIVETNTSVSEAAKKKAADKVFQQMVGPTAAQRLAAELPRVANVGGQTWEKVGNNYFNRQTNKVISTDEFVKLQRSSGTTTPSTAAPNANYRQGNYGQTTYNVPTTVPRTSTTAPGTTTPRTSTTAPGTTTPKAGEAPKPGTTPKAGEAPKSGTTPKAKLVQRGAVIKRFVQRNPKLAAALGIVAGVGLYKAGSAISDLISGEEEPPVTPSTDVTPAPAPAPEPARPDQSGKPTEPTEEQKWQAESDKLKAEIDALFKELEPVKDLPVPDELKRLRDKYQGTVSASNNATVSQSGKPTEKRTASNSRDPFRDTYAKYGQQNRREAEADAARKNT